MRARTNRIPDRPGAPGRGRGRRLSRGVRLGHVNLEVADLPRARRFYDRFLPLLGFVRIPDTGRYWLGYRKGRVAVWITVSRPARSRHADPHVPTDGRADPISEHLAFVVPSPRRVFALEEALRRRGFRPVYSTERQPTAGRSWYTSNAWADPDRHVIEIYAVTRRREGRRATLKRVPSVRRWQR